MAPSFMSKFVKPPARSPNPPSLVLTADDRDESDASGLSPDSVHRPNSANVSRAESVASRASESDSRLGDSESTHSSYGPETVIDTPRGHEQGFMLGSSSYSTPSRNRSRPSSIQIHTEEYHSDVHEDEFSERTRPRRDSSTSSVVSGSAQDPSPMRRIVESPDAIKPSFPPNNDPISPQLLATPDRDADELSLNSASGKRGKGWGRGSLNKSQKKRSTNSTGIAGALAASGLAMASTSGHLPVSTSQTFVQNARENTLNASVSSPSIPRTPSFQNMRRRQASNASSVQTGLSNADPDDSDYDSPDLDLNDDEIPVSGFAVASNKRNADFHDLFRSVPEGDYLIEDYGCALQREILIQGRLYISENHICFHANIFGWITDLIIPIYDIIAVEKKMTAFVIPNALQLTTRQNKYSFTSFLARDTTYDVIHNIWRLARPDVSSAGGGSTRASLEDVGGRPASERVRSASSNVAAPGSQKVTHCACGKNGEHYSEVASDTILPGTPEKVYTLMFASAFMKEFMREDQKLIDLQISDWEPASSDPKFLSRNMSYIKPLSGSLGPKQTKCELRDETVHFDFDDYVSTVTTTRTPDVPSGGVFAVKTRTCLTWAGNFATRVVVTTTVEWTGRSFIKSIIERSAIEGQKTYHADLEKHLKQYIAAHRSEFIPEGADESVLEPAAVAETAAPGTPSAGEALSPEDVRRKREQERSQRGLQWALDTFMGAYKVGKQSASGAIELLMDFWDNSSGTHILWILVFALLLSNVWTFLKMGKREEVGRRKAETRKLAEREQWIGDTVRILLQELRETPGSLPHVASSPTDSASSRKAEIAELLQSLDAIETRVARLKGTLDSLD